MKKIYFLLLICIIALNTNIQTKATVTFIDCPDCNNGHSPECQCKGVGEYPQNCDLCMGTGNLKCELCNGTGSKDGICPGCQGDGLSICNRCNGSKQQVYTCPKPFCKRCGGTGGYPEGSPEHIQQLKDEGKWTEEITEVKTVATTEVTTTTPITMEATTEATTIESTEELKTEEINQSKETEKSIDGNNLLKLKEEFIINDNLSIPVLENKNYNTNSIKKLSDKELKDIVNELSKIVDTVKTDDLKGDSELILKNYSIDKKTVKTISFDEHKSIKLDFFVKVTVDVKPKEFNDFKKAYAYHIIDADKRIEYLGEAELIKDENGDVIKISFMTDGFSDFFISDTKIDISNNKNDTFIKVLIEIIIIIVIGLIVYIILKKRGQKRR
jgi:hypothetical protein